MDDGHTMVDDVMVGDDGRGDPAYAGVGPVPADGKPSAVQIADGKPSAKPDNELARRTDSSYCVGDTWTSDTWTRGMTSNIR